MTSATGAGASRALLLFALAVVVLGAAFAPWLFWLGQLSGNEWLLAQPFRRYVNRSVTLVALVGLWPLLRALGFRAWRDVGFVRSSDWGRQVATGFALGFGSFLLAGAGSVLLGARALNFNHDAGEMAARLLKFLLTGILVGVLEETFFRGAVQGALQRSLRLPTALVTTSAIYSALHFLKPSGITITAAGVRWYSGFDCIAQVFSRSLAAPGVAVGFVTLFLAGMAVGWAFARTRALYISIGLHAGWVFTLKSYAYFTETGVDDFSRWVGGGALTENVLTWPVLLLVFWALSRICRAPAA
jgi:hypothetical protein